MCIQLFVTLYIPIPGLWYRAKCDQIDTVLLIKILSQDFHLQLIWQPRPAVEGSRRFGAGIVHVAEERSTGRVND